jgi:hypothetical protein
MLLRFPRALEARRGEQDCHSHHIEEFNAAATGSTIVSDVMLCNLDINVRQAQLNMNHNSGDYMAALHLILNHTAGLFLRRSRLPRIWENRFILNTDNSSHVYLS